jgi:hypothetical protein
LSEKRKISIKFVVFAPVRLHGFVYTYVFVHFDSTCLLSPDCLIQTMFYIKISSELSICILLAKKRQIQNITATILKIDPAAEYTTTLDAIFKIYKSVTKQNITKPTIIITENQCRKCDINYNIA